MEIQQVTDFNWTYCHYFTDALKAFVSIGGEEKPSGETSILYYVTVTDKEHQEVFQSKHSDLNKAIENLNKKYSHWNYFDSKNPPASDGCSSCSNK